MIILKGKKKMEDKFIEYWNLFFPWIGACLIFLFDQLLEGEE